MIKIYVGGTFDLFHYGHIRLFKRLKEMGGGSIVVVAVNGDDFAFKYKGKRTIMNEIERLEAVSSCKYVDLAFVMDTFENQPKFIELINPTFIAHGSDWVGKSLLKQLNIDEDFLKEHNIQMTHPDSTVGISSSDIIKRIIHDADD